MSFKSYKLIPIEEYDKIKLCKPIYSNSTEENEEKSKDITPNRSIQNIIEENLDHTEFKPGTHYVAEQNLIPQKGSGNKIPIFLPDTNELPQFSRAMKIEKSYNELSTVLNDNTLSDDLKIKLYSILKGKYDMNRKIHPSTVDGDKNMSEHRYYKVGELDNTINQAIDKFSSQEKRTIAREIIRVLIKYPEFVKWDIDGTIIYPNDVNMSLYRFLEILIYRKKGVKDEIEKLTHAIKPLARELIPYIYNIKVKEEVNRNSESARFSKYVSWL